MLHISPIFIQTRGGKFPATVDCGGGEKSGNFVKMGEKYLIFSKKKLIIPQGLNGVTL
jgi:hypothetical protein